MTSVTAPQLRIIQPLIRTLDALSPLSFGHFWGFFVAIINTLKILSVAHGDRTDPPEEITGSGYTDDEVRLIIATMVTAGKHAIPYNGCVDCIVLQAQTLSPHAPMFTKCSMCEHMAKTDLPIGIEWELQFSTGNLHGKGCYAGLMLSYTTFLPSIVPIERLSWPAQRHLQGDGWEECDSKVSSLQSKYPFSWVKVTLANGCHLACETLRTGKHTYWLAFIWINESGVEETLAIIQTNVRTDERTQYEVEFRQCIESKQHFATMPVEGRLDIRTEICSKLLHFVGTKVCEGYRFSTQHNRTLDLTMPGKEPLRDVVWAHIHSIGLTDGIVNGYSEAHIVFSAHSGPPVNHIRALVPHSGSRPPNLRWMGCGYSVACNQMIAKERTSEFGFVTRLAWVSAVVRVAGSKSTRVMHV
jgi:hypothetical protein